MREYSIQYINDSTINKPLKQLSINGTYCSTQWQQSESYSEATLFSAKTSIKDVCLGSEYPADNGNTHRNLKRFNFKTFIYIYIYIYIYASKRDYQIMQHCRPIFLLLFIYVYIYICMHVYI